MPVIAVSCIKPLRVLSYVRSPKAKTKAQGWAFVHIVTCPATELVAACPRLGCDSPPRSRRSHRHGPCVGKSRLSPTPSPVQTATSWLPEQWEPAVHMLGCTLTGRHSFEFHRETETKNLKERTLTAEPTLCACTLLIVPNQPGARPGQPGWLHFARHRWVEGKCSAGNTSRLRT
jgi:hypothetical protein